MKFERPDSRDLGSARNKKNLRKVPYVFVFQIKKTQFSGGWDYIFTSSREYPRWIMWMQNFPTTLIEILL